MNKTIIAVFAIILLITIMFFSNDGGSSIIAEKMELETIRGDVVELTGNYSIKILMVFTQ